MAREADGDRSSSDAKLSAKRCPNCGGHLNFEEDLPEGFCESCGIYVEILKPLEFPLAAEPERPTLLRAEVLAASKSDLQRLCRAYRLKTSGNKTDLLARVLRYMDRHRIDLPRDEAAEEVPEPPDLAMETAIKQRALLLFLLSRGGISRTAAESGANFFGSLDQFFEGSPDEVDLLAGVPAAEARRIKDAMAPPPPEALAEDGPEDLVTGSVDVEPEAPPPPIEPETPEPPPPTEAEIAEIDTGPPGEVEEQVTEEPVAAETREGADAGAFVGLLLESVEGEASQPHAAAAEIDTSRLRRDRAVFYLGAFLTMAGGFGLVLGSLLHDVFRVPLFGDTYDAFGSLNASAALLGGLLLAAGICAIGFGLRGGVVRPEAPTGV